MLSSRHGDPSTSSQRTVDLPGDIHVHTPSSASRQASESCHLETIYIEICPSTSGANNKANEKNVVHECTPPPRDDKKDKVTTMTPASLSSLKELKELEEEQYLLEKLLDESEERFVRETQHLEELIGEHEKHLLSSLRQTVHQSGKALEKTVEKHTFLDQDRELARRDRNRHFLNACQTADQASKLSVSLRAKCDLLKDMWMRSLTCENKHSALYDNLMSEGEKLAEAVVKSCARKHALRSAHAALLLNSIKDQQVVLQLSQVMKARELPPPLLTTVIYLRPVIPSKTLRRIAALTSPAMQRGFEVVMDVREKSITMASPRGKQVDFFPHSHFYTAGGATSGATTTIFEDLVVPILSCAYNKGQSATVFSYGGRKSGKCQMLFGCPQNRKADDADVDTKDAPKGRIPAEAVNAEGHVPVGISPVQATEGLWDDDVGMQDVSDQNESSSLALASNEGLVGQSIRWLLTIQKLNSSELPTSALSFCVYELYDDKLYDLLDFSFPPAEDPKDMKEIDKRGSKTCLKAPRELTLSQTRRENGRPGWEVDTTVQPIESVDKALSCIRHALSQLQDLRGTLAWSSIFVDIRFTVRKSTRQHQKHDFFLSKHCAVLRKETTSEECLTTSLEKHPECGGTVLPVRVVFCKLPGSQRSDGAKTPSAVRAAKKSLAALTDVVIALKKSSLLDESRRGVVPDNQERIHLDKSVKMWNTNTTSPSAHVSLSRSTAQVVETNLTIGRLFNVPITRGGFLLGRKPLVPDTLQATTENGHFVPYRNNKLTQVLFSSLHPNTRNVFIAALSPCSVLETIMPRASARSSHADLLVEAELRFNQQAQDMLSAAKYTLQYLKNFH